MLVELPRQWVLSVDTLKANHCLGAVMFLIEGRGQSILYTGDIRCPTPFLFDPCKC